VIVDGKAEARPDCHTSFLLPGPLRRFLPREKKVLRMLRASYSKSEFAARYGVDERSIRHIVN
jgi:hypothetical protein